MSTIKTKAFMDDFCNVLKKEQGMDFKENPDGTRTATIELSGFKIKIIRVKKHSVTIQIITEYRNKPLTEFSETELGEGSSYNLMLGDDFKITTKITLT